MLSDRNAAVGVAEFASDVAVLGDLGASTPRSEFVDWPLMRSKYWNDTAERPDRMERRMAEFLVHQRLPLGLITEVATQSEQLRARLEREFAAAGRTLHCNARPHWYYA